jgi:hypothetical protein
METCIKENIVEKSWNVHMVENRLEISWNLTPYCFTSVHIQTHPTVPKVPWPSRFRPARPKGRDPKAQREGALVDVEFVWLFSGFILILYASADRKNQGCHLRFGYAHIGMHLWDFLQMKTWVELGFKVSQHLGVPGKALEAVSRPHVTQKEGWFPLIWSLMSILVCYPLVN